MIINGVEREIAPKANLYGANLYGANLYGANLHGAQGLIPGPTRSDDYAFVGWFLKGALHINAGCRSFPIAEAREHWTRTRGGTPLGDETTIILDCIEALAKVRTCQR